MSAEEYEMRKALFHLTLEKPRQNGETILKTLFTYKTMNYLTSLFCNKVLDIASHKNMQRNFSFVIIVIIFNILYCTRSTEKYTGKMLNVNIIIPHSSFCALNFVFPAC